MHCILSSPGQTVRRSDCMNLPKEISNTKPGYQIAADHENLPHDSNMNLSTVGCQNTEEMEAENDQTRVKGNSKARKSRQNAGKAQGQKTLAEVMNPFATSSVHNQPEIASTEQRATWNEDEDNGRRKRRRTNSCEAHGHNGSHQPLQPAAAVEGIPQHVEARAASPSVIVPPPKPEAATTEEVNPSATAVPPRTPPKKMMKLNAGGKLSSPGNAKDDAKQSDAERRRRGRPRKAKEPAPPKSLVVVFRYATENEPEKKRILWERLERILAGEERIPKPTPTKKTKTTKKTKSSKPNHPFLSGKPAFKPAMKLESPRKASASTPGKLRRQALEDRTPNTSQEVPYPVGSALLKDRLMVKHPGAKEPSWPTKEQAHVRGLGEEYRPKWDSQARGKRKQKHFRRTVDSRESVLDIFTAALQPEPESAYRPDGFAEPRRDLRLPEKLLVSGEDVSKRVLSQIQAPFGNNFDDDEVIQRPNTRDKVHPGIAKLFNGIPAYLSAFDHCRGEVQGWTLKHAPMSAGEVLQSNQKMATLKNWLQSLTINTVEAVPSTKPAAKSAAKPKKKRQRPVDDLDDFLVDDDAGIHEMSFLPEIVELDEPSSRYQPKSIVQTSNGSKVSNAVLLSGPHGCGKTASAYAVAKELGFQIFEISSAERRSGRDVIDKVGDMTENHIVRHHGADTGETSASEDPTQMDVALQKDLESGRQGKMSAFFKKQPTPKPAAKPTAPKSQLHETQTIETLQKALKQPAKDQQQSLILLEEVDILFKEDKDFWTTVFKLLATSKRPFIMTCNDEDLVPMDAMALHAVLRYAPPPADSAVDLMLLMAAMEGHLLKREPVASLFEYKSHDLRASIAELDFWCQMGVGDPKGGLSWIYQRYPPGSDVDELGRPLRVISENTFQDGMGLLQPSVEADEDAVLFASREYGVEPTSLLEWQPSGEEQQKDISSLSLRDMVKLSDSLSAVDVYSTHSTVDASLPELSAKSRTHYTENLALLESNQRLDYSDMFERLAVSSTLLSCRALCPPEVADHVLSSDNLLRFIKKAATSYEQALTRRDFACFDAISVPISNSAASGNLEQSAFDGPFPAIATDLAPYVRSIAQYDLSLEDQRRQMNDLLGEGHKSKRARTTRAARSALEGSQRGITRRERWFPGDFDLDAALATGGKEWPKTVAEVKDVEMSDGSEAPASSMRSAAEASQQEGS